MVLQQLEERLEARTREARKEYLALALELYEHGNDALPENAEADARVTRILSAAGKNVEDLQRFLTRTLSLRQKQLANLEEVQKMISESEQAKARQKEIHAERVKIHNEFKARDLALAEEFDKLSSLRTANLHRANDLENSARSILGRTCNPDNPDDWQDWRNANIDLPPKADPNDPLSEHRLY